MQVLMLGYYDFNFPFLLMALEQCVYGETGGG